MQKYAIVRKSDGLPFSRGMSRKEAKRVLNQWTKSDRSNWKIIPEDQIG